jgi:hypothetical protein
VVNLFWLCCAVLRRYILRMGGAAWVVGCLSWAQVARAAVLSWPYPVRFSLLAKVTQQQWEAQQQLQEQQWDAQEDMQEEQEHSEGAPTGARHQQQLSGSAAATGEHSSGLQVESRHS